jgi:sterol 3beta-glucosyltransferase
MKIALLTYGSQGDVDPFIALAEALHQVGHHVKLAAPQTFSKSINTEKIEFIGLPGDPALMVDQLVNQAGKNPARMVSVMSRYVYPLAVEVLKKVTKSCVDVDLIVHSFLMTSTGYELARDIAVPDLSALFFPVFTTTGDFPAPAFPQLPLGPIYNRLTHHLISGLFKNGSQLIYKRVQSKNPALPDLSAWPFDPKNPYRTPIMYAFSSRIVPQPDDWPVDAIITGYWFQRNGKNWQPDPELVQFLESGPPPITIAFGSTFHRKMAEIQKRIIQAITSLNQRGVIVGSDLIEGSKLPQIHVTDYVPYQWLFNRSSLVMHHGGAGTTGRALHSGIPQLIVPFTSDQPFWANRMHQLGVSPKPISPAKLGTEKLRASMKLVLNDPQMTTNAKILQNQLEQEDGLEHAVNIIESFLKYGYS